MKRIQLNKRTDLKSEIPLKTPYCIFIDPSSACNFKCGFCMNKNIKSPSIMTMGLFQKLIDDLDEFESPVKTIRLYGFGEPLLNPNFMNMVMYAKASKKVLEVDTTTNASRLNYAMVNNLLYTGIDRINISIEAMNTESYRKFTNNKDVIFEEIVENVTMLYKNKKNTIIFAKINGDYLTPEEKDLFYKTFKPITDGCDIEHTMNCWRDVKVENVNQNVGIYGQELKEVMTCPYVFYSFFIHADGDASACFLDWNKKLVIGDAKNESLKSLWEDRTFWSLRNTMLNKNRKRHPVCFECNQLIAGMPVDLDAHAKDILKRI
jgi:MoaA/NifB/PqqE/SkfB family radical SAM enzyme